jgi:hypothetical protein
MPTYFRKTIKILPWVTLNLNKSGMSVSIGPRGAKLNISKKGAYFNTSIPGTGIYNKTKVGAALLWGIGTLIVVGLLGYALGIALQNFTLFVVMCAVAIVAGIAAFFIAKHFTGKTVVASEDEEEEEDERPARKTSKKTTKTERKAKTTTKGTKATKGSQRADNAPTKAYTAEVERLVEVMAEAETVEELNKAHAEILDIMYTNIKPQGVKVFGMDFDEALQTIEQDYAEGLKQLAKN